MKKIIFKKSILTVLSDYGSVVISSNQIDAVSDVRKKRFSMGPIINTNIVATTEPSLENLRINAVEILEGLKLFKVNWNMDFFENKK